MFHKLDIRQNRNLMLGSSIAHNGCIAVFPLQSIQQGQPAEYFVVECFLFVVKSGPIRYVIGWHHPGIQPELAGQFLERQFVHHVFNVVPVDGLEWNVLLVVFFV